MIKPYQCIIFYNFTPIDAEVLSLMCGLHYTLLILTIVQILILPRLFDKCSERWPQIFAQNVKSANRSYRLSLGGDYLPLGPDYIFLALLLHLLCKVSFLHLLHKHSMFLHLQLKMYLYNVLFSSTMQSIFSSFRMQRFYSTPDIQSVCLYWKRS